MWKSILAAVVVTACSLPAWAQRDMSLELGVKGGVGGYSYIDDDPGNRGVLGVEACAFCDRKYALFGDYDHWFRPNNNWTGYRSADSVAGGLRIQGRRKVRPFFDLGLAVGHTRYLNSSGTTVGAAFGAGVRFPIGERLYVRPQVRIQALTHGYVAGAYEVAAGWRF